MQAKLQIPPSLCNIVTCAQVVHKVIASTLLIIFLLRKKKDLNNLVFTLFCERIKPFCLIFFYFLYHVGRVLFFFLSI